MFVLLFLPYEDMFVTERHCMNIFIYLLIKTKRHLKISKKRLYNLAFNKIEQHDDPHDLVIKIYQNNK